MRLRGLRQIRQRQGMSISQLAELSDLRRESITRLEHGQDNVEPTLIRRLALVLGVSQRELITGLIVPDTFMRQDQLPAV
jgi:transcriptional regulator with XRE-family HTH domain